MTKILLATFFICFSVTSSAQATFAKNTEKKEDLNAEISKLKDVIKQIQENEIQSDKARYQKNYQLIINGIEIIKEMQQGAIEITSARNQNMLYKKLIDINNPTSEALGFQLQEVMNTVLEENLSLLPLVEHEKKRLKSTVANLFEGLKKTFPPLQIMSSAFSVISSFNTYKPRVEKLSKKVDSIVVDVTNPITKDVLQKINIQLLPYINFYTELNRTNIAFETALYQHEIQYRDFMEELSQLKDNIEKKLNLNESISGQVNELFDLMNSSSADFSYKTKLEADAVRDLVGNCVSVIELVDRYKKFTTDFIIIQDDFFKNNLSVLQKTAKSLPYKDVSKIDQLINDLNGLKNGTAENKNGFDASYKLRLKSILTKLYTINKLRA